jgi:hypothetical protein
MAMEGSLQEILERLLAGQQEMNARHERADACQEKANAEMKASQERANAEMKASQERANAEVKALQAEFKAAYAEMEARAVACPERFLASCRRIDILRRRNDDLSDRDDVVSRRNGRHKIGIYPGKTEAAVERQKLRENEINVDSIGSSEDRSGYRRLVVRRRRGAKKRTQDSVGSLQKLSAVRKRVIRHTVPAVCKGQMRKGPGKDRTTKGAPKRRRLKNIRRRDQECCVGIRTRGLKDQLCIRMKRTDNRITRKRSKLTSLFVLLIATREINENAFWKVRPPPKRKKPADSVGTGVLKRPATQKKKNKNGLVRENSHTSSRNLSRRTVLRREQRAQLENNHR